MHFDYARLTLSRLILGELPGDFIEFGAVAELCQGFFFLGVFLALRNWQGLVIITVGE